MVVCIVIVYFFCVFWVCLLEIGEMVLYTKELG